jgi:hypothetical protein
MISAFNRSASSMPTPVLPVAVAPVRYQQSKGDEAVGSWLGEDIRRVGVGPLSVTRVLFTMTFFRIGKPSQGGGTPAGRLREPTYGDGGMSGRDSILDRQRVGSESQPTEMEG